MEINPDIKSRMLSLIAMLLVMVVFICLVLFFEKVFERKYYSETTKAPSISNTNITTTVLPSK